MVVISSLVLHFPHCIAVSLSVPIAQVRMASVPNCQPTNNCTLDGYNWPTGFSLQMVRWCVCVKQLSNPTEMFPPQLVRSDEYAGWCNTVILQHLKQTFFTPSLQSIKHGNDQVLQLNSTSQWVCVFVDAVFLFT